MKPKVKKLTWTRESAIDWLVRKQGAKLVKPTVIHKDGTFTGLKACSAIDYLRNVHGFAIRAEWEEKPAMSVSAKLRALLKLNKKALSAAGRC